MDIREKELKKGYYFIHGYYLDKEDEIYKEPGGTQYNRVILIRESIDNVYDINTYNIDTYDIAIERLGENNNFSQGELVYYNKNRKIFRSAENEPVAMMYRELNMMLSSSIKGINYYNKPTELATDIVDVYSYHINVGHGNCTIIVYGNNDLYSMLMVDCSVRDMITKKKYCSNIDDCFNTIQNKFGVSKISKLLITHLHYDHINGINYLISEGYMDKNTEVWMNTQYPWKQKTYDAILLNLKSLGVKFIDPIKGNSTNNIKILYPRISFNEKLKAPKNNINNASVVYNICLNGKSMLFAGDIEVAGWDNVDLPVTNDIDLTYYCISHHASATGHNKHNGNNELEKISNYCVGKTQRQILMGRDGAYKGIFNQNVLQDFDNVFRTDSVNKYFELNWQTGEIREFN